MVLFIGNSGIVRKYACTTCIKGHRSSRCRHTNRALIEVKPKGRPISQCTTCRERRKTMRAHVKCSC
ncbi:copper fist DNA binding domain-containing protein, partial [Dichotomocladium elegans]